MKSHKIMQQLALTALMAATVNAFAGNNDESYTPKPFGPLGGLAHNETQSMYDRGDWLKIRFSGSLGKDFFGRALVQIQAQAARHPELLAGHVAPVFIPKWRSIGPIAAQIAQNGIAQNIVDSGRVNSILPHPTDSNTVYVLSSGGGLWKTTNFNSNAPTWQALTDAGVTTSGGAAALGSNPNTIYMVLGDPFDGISLLGGYVQRSTDGGNTWSLPLNLPTATTSLDLKVDTSGSTDTVLVATNGGLYRSVDGGISYAPANGISTSMTVSSLAKTSAGWLAVAYAPGAASSMFVSTDGGANFVPTANNGNGYTGAFRATLAVGAPGDKIVYAIAAASNSDQQDMFRSVDGGQTWTALGLNGRAPVNPNSDQPDLNVMHGQAWYNQMVIVDPSDTTRNTVYFGGNLSTVKSTDGGQTWTVQTNWLGQFGLAYTHADAHTAAISMANGIKRIFYGNDGGLFISDDGGTTWNDRKNIGLVDHLTYSLATSGTDASSVITGLQDNGTRLRINGSGVFNQTSGGDGFGVGWSQATGKAVIGSYVGNSIYYSTVAPTDQSMWNYPTISQDGCHSNGIDICNAYFYTTIYTPTAAADPTGGVFYARSFHELWRTANGGASWNSISSTDPNAQGNSIRAADHVIGVHPTDGNRIAAAASGRRVRITTDAGASWTTQRLPTSVTDGFNSNVAWINNTSMYVASENANFQSSGCWLAKTTDLGVTWSKACNGLPQLPISKVLVSPADPSGLTAYAATWIGVYKTTNGGLSWDQFGAGLPVVHVTDLYMPARGGFLRVSTYGRGIWEIPTPR
ncbi:hypothetical protein AAKU64_004489 [Undibacterium sp. GrIS 1.8]|uniref:WD40/YVTN/BNR-like repeat-containing protein n=1 Tax=unclassified Undibacterium TaxID=2630295 RepID=UPI003397AC6F